MQNVSTLALSISPSEPSCPIISLNFALVLKSSNISHQDEDRGKSLQVKLDKVLRNSIRTCVSILPSLQVDRMSRLALDQYFSDLYLSNGLDVHSDLVSSSTTKFSGQHVTLASIDGSFVSAARKMQC